MSFYRSDTINHYKLILPQENSWAILNQLGKKKIVQVKNGSDMSIKPFSSAIKRCEDLLQKTKQIEALLVNLELASMKTQLTEQELMKLYEIWDQYEEGSHNTTSSYFDTVEQQISKIWEYYLDLNKSRSGMKDKLNFLKQNLAIIRAGELKFGQSFYQTKESDGRDKFLILGSQKFRFRAVVLPPQQVLVFERTIQRITNGNFFINKIQYSQLFYEIDEGQSSKTVIFIFYPGAEKNHVDKKITKIIEQYCKNQSLYLLPKKDQDHFRSSFSQMQKTYVETQHMHEITKNQVKTHFKYHLQTYPGLHVHRIDSYRLYLLKERQIFRALNQMDVHSNFLKANVFIREEDISEVQQILVTAKSYTDLPPAQLFQRKATKIPTSFQLNSYNSSAQQVVETYGVARYKEANPSFFTTVTFPFLFGVMFGDMAHGFILFCFGLFLIFSTPTNSITKALHPHRYLLTLMGFFATYCGFIYNDFMSFSLNLFGSCYNIEEAEAEESIKRLGSECVYIFGLDPVWSQSTNNLNYVNSLKMKISVIIAVLHMTLGVCVKASNTIYFGQWLQFFFQFIPQLLFMLLLFGYMIFLIIFKWLSPWKLYDSEAPSIITTMINLPLKLGKTDSCCGGQPMWGDYDQTSQDDIQLIFLLISALCIPLMLFPKPIYHICSQENSSNLMSENQISYFEIDESRKTIPENQQEKQEASQIFVHQLIETIEYVLGCISNTASYLRLWALSLAHSQLSEVFFQKTIESGIASGLSGIPIMILGFPVLAGATFGVLLCMDSMECFLHTLRLHWVQFQNKFYKGDGFAFNPLSFQNCLGENIKQK